MFGIASDLYDRYGTPYVIVSPTSVFYSDCYYLSFGKNLFHYQKEHLRTTIYWLIILKRLRYHLLAKKFIQKNNKNVKSNIAEI